MIKRYFAELKKFNREYGAKKILDAVLAGFLFSALIFFPVYFILTEIMVVYVYLYVLLTILFIAAAIGHEIIWHLLAKQALNAKKPDHESNLGFIFAFSMVFFGLIVLAIGLFILFVMLPIWMV